MMTLLSLLAAYAASPIAVVVEGDDVPGVGNVTTPANLAVSNNGTWQVEVDTDHPDTDADSVLIRAGVGVVLREGDAIAPTGATLDSFDSMPITETQAAYNHFLDGPPSGFDSGVYLGSRLVIQEGDAATYPSASAGTAYIGFFDVRLNNLGQLLVMASVDDPAIASSVDRALVRLTPSGGSFVAEAVAQEGQLLPGQMSVVQDMETNPHNIAFNDNGQAMFIAELDAGSTIDHAIYIDDTLIAQEGSGSPAGASYNSLASKAVALNDLGEFAFTATLNVPTTMDSVILRGNSVVMQEGMGHPDIGAGFVFTSFGTGPLGLGNNGNFAWYGDWDDSNTDVDTGLFVNGRLLLQEGDTLSGIGQVDTIRGVTEGMTMSPNGRWLLQKVVLTGSVDAVLLYDLADEVRVADITPGIPGQSNDFIVRHAVPGHRVAIVGAGRTGTRTVPCGGGTITLDLANPTLLGIEQADMAGTASITRPLPGSLAGQSGFAQAVDLTSCTVGQVTNFSF